MRTARGLQRYQRPIHKIEANNSMENKFVLISVQRRVTMKLVTNQNTLTQQSIKLLLTMSLLLAVPVFADYELIWSTIDGGGGTSSGGQYSLTATIGQHDAAYSQGGDYEVLGGFWPGGPLCFVEFDDFARFTVHWRDTGPGLPADLYEDNIIDELDLELFVYEWLYECPYGWPLK